MVWLWLWQLLIGHHGHTVILGVFSVSAGRQILFLDKVDRRTLKSQIEPASAVPGEERGTLHARCDFWCFSTCPLRLLFLGTQRCRFGFRCLPGNARFKLRLLALLAVLTGTLLPRVPLLALLEVRKGPWLPSRNRGRWRWAAPPCCARPFVLDRAVKEHVCRTPDAVPSCPCTVMYSRRSSRPQPMGSGGDATPCKVTREGAGCRLGDRKIERDLSGV